MPQRVRILCVNKQEYHDIHDHIIDIGGMDAEGFRWKMTQQEAVNLIKNGTRSFYVSTGGHIIDVVVGMHNGHEYLKTLSDIAGKNYLVDLPECP